MTKTTTKGDINCRTIDEIMKLLIIPLAAALLVFALTATCLGDSGSPQTVNASSGKMDSSLLKEIVLGSNVQPDAYLFTLEMNQKMIISNISDSNGTKESQEILTKSNGAGALNLTGKAMKMVMATLAVETGHEENTSATSMEMYLLNDTMYMKVDGNWTETKIPGLSMKDVWRQQDKMGQQQESLNGSNITLLGMEKIGGTECYKVEVIPDMKSYTAVAKEQLGTTTILPYLNISALFDNTSISYVSWISKDGHLPLRTEIATNMTLRPEILGLPAKKAGILEMHIETSYAMQFNGFDRRIKIALPENARKAVTFQAFVSGNSTQNSTRVVQPKQRDINQ